MKKTIDMPRVNVSAPFPIELEVEARIAAARQGISRSELVRRAVKEYLIKFAATQNKKERVSHHDNL